MSETLLLASIAGVLGLMIGSFLNVCISRLPDDYSVVTPRSHCPRCGAGIAWYDNIPLLSYAALGGRCRSCRGVISPRYVLVELLTGLLFFGVVMKTGGGWPAVKWCAFAAILVELIFSDFETHILPDEFTKWGTVIGLMLAPVVRVPEGLPAIFVLQAWPEANGAFVSFCSAAAASAMLAGGLWLMGAMYRRLRGREGLGFGDVKMVAMLGAFLGMETALVGLMLGSLAGSLVGIVWIKARGLDTASYELPFGSFLGVGALAAAWLSM